MSRSTPSARALPGLLAALMAVTALGCSEANRASAPAQAPAPLPDGGLVWSVAAPLTSTSIAGVHFAVSCKSGFTHDVVVPLEDEILPPWLDGPSGTFADGFTVVPPGVCTVVATAVDASGQPVEDCAPASTSVVIAPEQTTEVVLPISCVGADLAAFDAVGVLNFAPQCVELLVDPGGEIVICQGVAVEVVLADPEGDAIESVTWAVVDSPAGSAYYLEINGTQITFSADDPGIYWIEVTAVDEWGATSSFTFPIPVTLTLDPDACGPDGLCVDDFCTDEDPCTVDTCVEGVCQSTTLEEVCDGVDNDCDGSADEDCTCSVTGDVTGSSSGPAVTVADVQCLILTTLWNLGGQAGPPPACLGDNGPGAADLNCDGSVEIADIQLTIVLALGNPLPGSVDPNGNGCADACEPNPCGNGVCEPEESQDLCPLDCP